MKLHYFSQMSYPCVSRIDAEEYSTKYYRESNWEILWYKYEVIMYKGW